MFGFRKSVTVVALAFGLFIASVPAAHASDGCMPRLDPQYLAGDLVDCAEDVIVPLINWPPT